MVGIVSVLMSWLPKYLITERGFDLTSSAALAAAPFFGTVMGNFIGGVLSDRVLNKRRKPLMLLSAGATIFTMYALVYAPESKIVLSLMLFLLGLMLSLGYSAYSVYASVGRNVYATDCGNYSGCLQLGCGVHGDDRVLCSVLYSGLHGH